MRLELETYKSKRSRHTCPACGSRHSFARYKKENGEYLADDVGRCNRESKCGYHKKPKEYFAENPQLSNFEKAETRKKTRANYGFTNVSNMRQEVATISPKKPDYVEQHYLLRTLGNYNRNPFVQFLFNLFPEDEKTVWKAVKDYLIGTAKDGKTIFWQIDGQRRVRTGKLIAYDCKSGKRRKDIFPNWIHSELKKSGHLKEDFELRQCFFGEHLLTIEKKKPVAVVEAEKTAIIASICFPEFVWLAAGAKQNLNVEKLQRLGEKQIVIYPDADSFARWHEVAVEARTRGLTVKVSSLVEQHATAAQKANGYDLADFLINQQTEINEFNVYADDYNARLEMVLNDENLNNRFNSIFDERKAAMMVGGNLSEMEAERLLSDPASVRQVVMNL